MTPHLTPRATASVALMIVLGCASSLRAQEPPQGWAWQPVVPVLTPLRVLIIYDMEGLSGIDRHAMTTCKDLASYAAGQDRLAEDVNAVVEGLVAAGVAKIEVVDRHGSGCDATPDLPVSRMHPRATYVDETSSALFTRVTQRQWDAVALVGAHASPGHNGFLEHVGSFGIERILNGVSVSESEQQGLMGGNWGLPIIFSSGDDRLGAQLKERMPWVTFVETKRATSRTSAALRPPAAVRADLIFFAKLAVASRNRTKTITLLPPFTGAYKPVYPLTLEPLGAIPGVDISAGLIRVTGSNPREVNEAINRISILIASVHTADAHWEAVNGDEKLDRFRDSVFMAQWRAGPPEKGSSRR